MRLFEVSVPLAIPPRWRLCDDCLRRARGCDACLPPPDPPKSQQCPRAGLPRAISADHTANCATFTLPTRWAAMGHMGWSAIAKCRSIAHFSQHHTPRYLPTAALHMRLQGISWVIAIYHNRSGHQADGSSDLGRLQGSTWSFWVKIK